MYELISNINLLISNAIKFEILQSNHNKIGKYNLIPEYEKILNGMGNSV